MAYEVFTDRWAEEWAKELRASEAYGKAAAGWEGAVCLEATAAGATAAAVFVDLWHGECRAARAATAEDLDTARYVLRADLATWRRVLDGELDPMLGLMSGQLTLRRGNLAGLTPYFQASKEMVAAAARVDTAFP